MGLRNGLVAVAVLWVSGLVWAQAPAAGDKPAESRIAAVTVYQNTALITRHLDAMGVDPALWLHALETPPNRLYYLSPEELQQHRLVTAASHP